MAGSETKCHYRHYLDCRPRHHCDADAVVCACTPALHPVAIQRTRLRRMKLNELWLAPLYCKNQVPNPTRLIRVIGRRGDLNREPCSFTLVVSTNDPWGPCHRARICVPARGCRIPTSSMVTASRIRFSCPQK